MTANKNFANPLAPDWLEVPENSADFSPKIWPANLSRNSSGEAVLAGKKLSELTAEYGSPLYLLDEDFLKSRISRLKTAFDSEFAAIGTKVKVYYAGKAFLSSYIIRLLIENGYNIDVCTGGELALALAAGAPAERLALHGNNKSLEEINRSVEVGLGAIIIDHAEEIDQIAEAAIRLGKVQSVRLRVRTGVHAHTHEFMATAHEDQKFGVSLSEAEVLVAKIRSYPELKFLGLHAHIGSQIFGVDGFAASAKVLMELHLKLSQTGEVPELNIGGGFGIAYTNADKPEEIETLAKSLATEIGKLAAEHQINPPVIAIEPGRWIIGPTGVAVYDVGAIKDVTADYSAGSATRRYVSVNGGMSDNARPALYGADYTVRLSNRVSEADPVLVRVVGKHCESGDIVVNNDYLPADIKANDQLVLAATGAYCWSLASNYNYLARPAVVAVADGQAKLLIRRETEADLLRRDADLI